MARVSMNVVRNMKLRKDEKGRPFFIAEVGRYGGRFGMKVVDGKIHALGGSSRAYTYPLLLRTGPEHGDSTIIAAAVERFRKLVQTPAPVAW